MSRAIEPHDLLVAFLETQIVLDRASENFFQAYGISGAQFNILNLLALNGGAMDQVSLTQRLVVGKSSISIVLRRMVEHGLVAREQHPEDKRQSVLQLAKPGRELWEQVHDVYEETVDRVFGAIPPKQRQALLQNLRAIRAELER